MLRVIFAEYPTTMLAHNGRREVTQFGRGIVVYTYDGRICFHENDNEFSVQLNGCEIIQSKYNNVIHILGLDHLGVPWTIEISEVDKHETARPSEDAKGRKRLRPSRDQILRLIRGQSFAEIIADAVEEVRAQEMALLRDRAEKTQALEELVAAIFEINETAGPKSRTRVRDAILAVEPGLANSQAA